MSDTLGLTPLPAGRLGPPEDLTARLGDDDLVYFCCNVGDADAQVVLLPKRPPHQTRRVIVVDAGLTGKVDALLLELASAGLLPGDGRGGLAPDAIALVIATHPHADHIQGLPQLLARFGNSVVEVWDSGYWHPIRAFHETMAQIECHPHIVYAQPASGSRRWIHDTRITVLGPSIALKSRFDTYGVEINDASLALRIDYPASRVLQRDGERQLLRRERTASLILGADAQNDSWAHVVTDFPRLHATNNAAARAIRGASGADDLRADVLKVAHHGSKRGLNLELVERIDPKLTIVSCQDHNPRYNFPHQVAQEVLREAIQPTAGTGTDRIDDFELPIFYTADKDDAGQDLGTMAVRLRPQVRDIWRLGDDPAGTPRLDAARPWRTKLVT